MLLDERGVFSLHKSSTRRSEAAADALGVNRFTVCRSLRRLLCFV
jgi:hypothetical protein